MNRDTQNTEAPTRHKAVALLILYAFASTFASGQDRPSREPVELEPVEWSDIIEEYAREQVPLIVPITLFRHYIFKYQSAYLMQQHYLYPHPSELKLRNHA